MQPEDPEAKRLLKECMKRGIESIERSTTMSTRQAQSLYDSASESDKRVLKDIVLAGPQQDYIGLMDDADGRYFMSPTGGRPVSWSVPSILIAEMELSGQGGGDEYILPPPSE